MPKSFPTILDIVGGTPVVRLQRLPQRSDVELLVKLDYLNPGGSTKDRPLIRMIEEAERSGDLKPGATIIDSSSGNFAIAMAMAGAAKGYPVICVVDPKLTNVVRGIIKSLGGDLIFATKADEAGSYLRSRLALRDELVRTTPGAWCPDQYRNRFAIASHYDGTGAEIVEAVEGKLDALVVAVGTGSTISGSGRIVKESIPGVKIIAADAIGSKIFDPHGRRWLVKGLGSGLTAEELTNLELTNIDEVRLIGDEDALVTARALARNEGILAGGSAGCALFAGLTVSREMEPGSRVLVVLADRLERYLFEHQMDAWMEEREFSTETDASYLEVSVTSWRQRAEIIEGPGGLKILKPTRSVPFAINNSQSG